MKVGNLEGRKGKAKQAGCLRYGPRDAGATGHHPKVVVEIPTTAFVTGGGLRL